MCIFPLGYGSISRMYFFGASGRRSARKRPISSQRFCQAGSRTWGVYRSERDMALSYERLPSAATSLGVAGLVMLSERPMSLPIARISDIARFENQEVELRGWIYNKRSSGKLHFLQVRDGSGIIQAVLFKND